MEGKENKDNIKSYRTEDRPYRKTPIFIRQHNRKTQSYIPTPARIGTYGSIAKAI
jgi:hypothetical protein